MSGRCRSTAVLLCIVAGQLHGPAPASADTDSLRTAYTQVASLLERGAASDALALAETSRARAASAGQRQFELVFLSAMVNAQAALYNLRSAIATAKRATALARQLRHSDSQAAVAGLLADIYTRLGQYDLAWAVAADAVRLKPPPSPRVQWRLLAVMGTLKFNLGDKSGALALFSSAIAGADDAGDHLSAADAWDRLGYRLLESGDRAAAEHALTEGFRLRRMHRDRGIDISLRGLGMLKLASGDARSAKALLDRAAELIESGRSRVQPWSVYYHRALARRALGDLRGALADFERTFELAARLRTDLVPVDEVQSYVDVQFRRFYSDYVSAGMELYARDPSPRLAAQMFLASEANRASGLRQTAGWRERLPSSYWELVSELRSLTVASLSRSVGAEAARIRALEGELTRLESQAGFRTVISSERKLGARALSQLRAALREGEALLSFHLGDDDGNIWALTKHGLEVHRIAARPHLSREVQKFRDSLRGGSGGPDAENLFHMLFGQLSRRVRSCPDWIVVADDALFQLPFPALRDRGKFLVERRSVRLLPSAFMLGAGAAESRRDGLLAMGDPIYNAADPRRPRSPRPAGIGTVSAANLELARIPASATEVRECAREWKDGPAVVLTGADASRTGLETALLRRPAALHMAVHVVGSEDGSRALIALGLDVSGRPDFLDAFEISRKRYGVPMVVLSGCSSGRGRVLPGAGLTGLTRAWLLGGSQAVTASHWPTADDTGALFRVFYRSLARSREPLTASRCARALRTAQLEMLRSASWRAEPRYWAAFFVTGRD